MDWSIHHVNVQTHDVKASAKFYQEIIGLTGQRSWPDAKKTTGNTDLDEDHVVVFGDRYRGLHLVKGVADFARRNNLMVNPTIGGHVAYTVKDLSAVARRLEAAGIPFSLNPNIFMDGVRNMYLYDPSFNLIEVNEVVG